MGCGFLWLWFEGGGDSGFVKGGKGCKRWIRVVLALMVVAKVVTDDYYGGLCIDKGDDHLGWQLASGILGGGG